VKNPALYIVELWNYEWQYYTSASKCSSETTVTVTMTYTHIEGISFTKFGLFFQMRQMLYAGCVNSVLMHRELFTNAAFQLIVYRETSSSKYIFQGTKKMELEGGGGDTNQNGAKRLFLIPFPVWVNASNSLFFIF